MKAGAVDYILKDKISRLRLAVIASLENKKVKVERRRIRREIEDALKEKELLLHEIYHRVNSNMQIIINLFNMQIKHAKTQGEKDVLTVAQARIGAMSAIYSAIYQERSFTTINSSEIFKYRIPEYSLYHYCFLR